MEPTEGTSSDASKGAASDASKGATTPPVALVTGGGRRVGRAICETLHARGYNVVVHCRNSRVWEKGHRCPSEIDLLSVVFIYSLNIRSFYKYIKPTVTCHFTT